MNRPDPNEHLRRNIERVRENIQAACRRAGRDPGQVRLVAVTKYADLELVRALPELGVLDVGESRPQQLVQRAQVLGAADAGLDHAPTGRLRWHLIGHLQRNKVKALLNHSRIIHSLDSAHLADEIQKHTEKRERSVDAFLEVNVAGEQSKHGVVPDALAPLAEHVAGCTLLRLRGLMTMAPLSPDPEQVRPHFARLRELLTGLREAGVVGPDCRELSMGMTQDYTVAVEEGATFVRIGSALYDGVETPAAPAGARP